MVPPLSAAMPRRGGPTTRALGRLVLRLLGWRIVGELPNVPKVVAIAAPHRSNWDFIVGLAAKFALSLDAVWLGKHTLFRWPFGALFRFWGGIPVDRGSSHDTVAAVTRRFASSEQLVLALAPEGTRTPGSAWKTGFWHMAQHAGVPVFPVVFDRPNRILHFLPVVELSELDADIEKLKAEFDRIVPGSAPAR